MIDGAKSLDEITLKRLKELFGWLSGYLDETGFVAGTKHMTIADLMLYSWVSALISLKKYILDTDEYPKVLDWAEKVKGTLPHPDKSSEEGIRLMIKYFEEKSGLLV